MENKMTVEWVVKNFLPNYEERLNTMYGNLIGCVSFFVPEFCKKHFPEALAEMLKAQREECSDAWHIAICDTEDPYRESVSKAICNAPTPEPKNK